MKIIMEFKVHDDDGQLKFGRDGKVQFEFLDPKRTTPALIAFRRFYASVDSLPTFVG